MRMLTHLSRASASMRISCSIGLGLLLVVGCGPSEAELKANARAEQIRLAIRRVFDADATLAKSRDLAIGDGKSLSNSALTIRNYIAAAGATDLTDLPEDLCVAYTRHLDAWRAGSAIMDHYVGITGLFRSGIDGDAYVVARLDVAQKAIDETWADVKAKAKAYGVELRPAV